MSAVAADLAAYYEPVWNLEPARELIMNSIRDPTPNEKRWRSTHDKTNDDRTWKDPCQPHWSTSTGSGSANVWSCIKNVIWWMWGKGLSKELLARIKCSIVSLRFPSSLGRTHSLCPT